LQHWITARSELIRRAQKQAAPFVIAKADFSFIRKSRLSAAGAATNFRMSAAP
jgi:hypothetical protein